MTRQGFLKRQRDLFPNNSSAGAIISSCENYRYVLWRQWDFGKGTLVFIGLNPSTADAVVDDATIRRCQQFAMDWGFQKLVMLNLFAFRATEPADMRASADPIGPENDDYLALYCQGADRVVAAWGNDGAFLDRDRSVRHLIAAANPQCFRLTARGQPIHPLYQRKDAPLIDFGLRAVSAAN